jgi:hypothetical protein
MAMNFPANPQDGDRHAEYIYDSDIGAWVIPPPEAVDKQYVDDALDLKINLSEKQQQLGVPALDENGNLYLYQMYYVTGDPPSTLDTIEKLANMFKVYTTEEWALITETLPAGSINVEVGGSGRKRAKIGTGIGAWSDLEYIPDNEDITVALSTVEEEHQNIYQAIDYKADADSPTFIGDVVLPSTTTIGSITYENLSTVEGLTESISNLLDAKLSILEAASTYAPIVSPSFSGTVSLPYSTTIGSVLSEEIDTLSGISTSESIQSQIDNLDSVKAPLDSPTFTGTVEGITSTLVGLGNVDNTSDSDKPISTATQSALDLKAELSGATFTGAVTLSGDPTQAMHASTKAYVDNVSSGILAKPSVIAATTANLNSTYDNGSSGVGATLTSTTNVAFPLIDGVSVTTINGQRGVLVKNQTNSFENGRYNLTTQGDENTPWVLTRCGLCDQANEIPGAYVFVTDGSVNGQTGWVQHVDDPGTFTVGTDDIDVFQFAGAGSITAGTNIEVSGNEVSVVDSPVFAEVVDVSSSGIQFEDGIQTKVGVPSQTSFVYKTDSYTLDSLDLADNIIEIDSTSATTITIPLDSSVNYPVGTSIDILQTNTGQVTVAATGGVTINGTPGFKLRTRWSSATILKRAENSWIVYGDLTA